jgi:hypothetical protein
VLAIACFWVLFCFFLLVPLLLLLAD